VHELHHELNALRDQNVQLTRNVAWMPSRNNSRFPPKLRDRVDTSIVNTVSNKMRYMCLEVTMEMIKNLKQSESGDKLYCAVRDLMMVAYGTPTKVMNVGLYPNTTGHSASDLLRTRILAHDVRRVHNLGADPIQGMAEVEIYIKHKIKCKKKGQGPYQESNEYMLMSKFAMLLRCSYVCSAVSVAFTNCVSMSVDTMVKRTMCASFFSNWFGEIVKIHNSFGFEIIIMATGASAADTMRRTFSS